MEPEFFNEDDLLPDDVLERLETELPENCLSCELRDSEPLDDLEARA
jgi:hypothetical protein